MSGWQRGKDHECSWTFRGSSWGHEREVSLDPQTETLWSFGATGRMTPKTSLDTGIETVLQDWLDRYWNRYCACFANCKGLAVFSFPDWTILGKDNFFSSFLLGQESGSRMVTFWLLRWRWCGYPLGSQRGRVWEPASRMLIPDICPTHSFLTKLPLINNPLN